MNKFDRRHQSNLNRILRQIDEIYKAVSHEAAKIGASISDFNPDTLFSFSDYPVTRKKVNALLQGFSADIQGVIVNGIKSAWTLANNKNNELSRQVFGDALGKIPKRDYDRYFATNERAQNAFIKRRESGLNLSDRVWNYTDQFKNEIEMALDCGIRDGLSADEMSRQVRDFLKYPDKLFRRVRDEHDELQLSKAAKAFHPGRGVYRSSYKNARRLAATESNIAYRTADYLRWQDMDFVVGIEIHTSQNHPITDICDDLKGKYPKDFKFTGWHPHCRCYATSILKTMEENQEDIKRILSGQEPSEPETSSNYVPDVPDGFNGWVKKNATRIIRARQLPYFMTDNAERVLGIAQRYQPNTKLSEIMANDYFWGHISDFHYEISDRYDDLYEMFNDDSLTDLAKAMVINEMKQELARYTALNLKEWGAIGEDWVLARTEMNAVVQRAATWNTHGKAIPIPEVKMDVMIFKDPSGREFAYPVGVSKEGILFSAKEASEAISELPPYLRDGIKRVSFFDIDCPADPYWRVHYEDPKHVSLATDGGRTTFWQKCKDKAEFKGYMTHEAAHIIDGPKHAISGSKDWQAAVAKDDAIWTKRNASSPSRVSIYARTNDSEDFAECVRVYINDHEKFKKWYPNRAAFIRLMAQKLSGHFPKRP